MITISENTVQITSPSLAAFVTAYQDYDNILQLTEEHIESFCRNMTNFLVSNDERPEPNDPSSLISYLQDFERRIFGAQDKQLQITSDQGDKVAERLTVQLAGLITSIEKAVTRSGDMTTLQGSIKSSIAECMSSFHTETIRHNCELKSTTDAIHRKVESIAALKHQGSKAKGESSEIAIYELLCSRLHPYAGYNIERVHGKERSCDIKICKNDEPTIRIEVKNYGEFNGLRVPEGEVEKFQRDLLTTNDHGIFISLNTGISGMGEHLDFQVLPNRKIAVYVSNNRYDVDVLTDLVFFIYRLDKVIKPHDKSESYELTRQTVDHIQSFLRNFTEKLSSAKAHIKQSLDLLNNITLDSIEGLILGTFEVGEEEGSTLETREKPFSCDICKQPCASRQTILNHRRDGCPRLKKADSSKVENEDTEHGNKVVQKVGTKPRKARETVQISSQVIQEFETTKKDTILSQYSTSSGSSTPAHSVSEGVVD